MNNPPTAQQTNNVNNIANSGINQLADTAAAQLSNSATSNQFNSQNNNNNNQSSHTFLESNNIAFLEADASFASGVAPAMTSIPLPSTSSATTAPLPGLVMPNVNKSNVGMAMGTDVTNNNPPHVVSDESASYNPSSNSVGVGGLNNVSSPTAGNTMFSTATNFSSSVSPSTSAPPSKRKKTGSAKQHQLPMFLTSKFYVFEILLPCMYIVFTWMCLVFVF